MTNRQKDKTELFNKIKSELLMNIQSELNCYNNYRLFERSTKFIYRFLDVINTLKLDLYLTFQIYYLSISDGEAYSWIKEFGDEYIRKEYKFGHMKWYEGDFEKEIALKVSDHSLKEASIKHDFAPSEVKKSLNLVKSIMYRASKDSFFINEHIINFNANKIHKTYEETCKPQNIEKVLSVDLPYKYKLKIVKENIDLFSIDWKMKNIYFILHTVYSEGQYNQMQFIRSISKELLALRNPLIIANVIYAMNDMSIFHYVEGFRIRRGNFSTISKLTFNFDNEPIKLKSFITDDKTERVEVYKEFIQIIFDLILIAKKTIFDKKNINYIALINEAGEECDWFAHEILLLRRDIEKFKYNKLFNILNMITLNKKYNKIPKSFFVYYYSNNRKAFGWKKTVSIDSLSNDDGEENIANIFQDDEEMQSSLENINSILLKYHNSLKCFTKTSNKKMLKNFLNVDNTL